MKGAQFIGIGALFALLSVVTLNFLEVPWLAIVLLVAAIVTGIFGLVRSFSDH